MNQVINISNWTIKQWIQTTGSRNKFLLENPENEKIYFFKESINKYPSEFWSEVIASKIGKYLGFNILDYNVSISNEIVGCLCESMIDQASEELEHGINLIKKAVPNFKIVNRPIILFTDVEKSFIPYNGFINKFIEMLVFDAIIGNQDRHSENWAIIRSLDVENIQYNKDKVLKWLYNQYKSSGLKLHNLPLKKYFLNMMQESSLININFSPIYDSGSSLGREIPETNINNYLMNDKEVEKYIKNGRSEIKWDGSKINHFDLLLKLRSKYEPILQTVVNRVLNKYHQGETSILISEIDKELPAKFQKSSLSLERKILIAKFIDYRIHELKKILN